MLKIIFIMLTIFVGCLPKSDVPTKPKINGYHTSQITVADDTLYFGAGYCLYSLDLTTRVLDEIICTSDWLFQQLTINGQYAYTQILVAPGLGPVYVALNLSTGDIVWAKEPTTGYAQSTDKISVMNDIVYITQTDRIVARDSKTGEIIWQTDHNWMLNAGVLDDGLIWYPISTESRSWASIFTPGDNFNGALVGIEADNGTVKAET